jgi:hypothetical protein
MPSRTKEDGPSRRRADSPDVYHCRLAVSVTGPLVVPACVYPDLAARNCATALKNLYQNAMATLTSTSGRRNHFGITRTLDDDANSASGF